jgi:hypothetical protein
LRWVALTPLWPIRHAAELLEALSFVTTVIHPFLSVEQTVQFEQEIWHWCVRRKVSLTKVRFSNVEDDEELILLDKLLGWYITRLIWAPIRKVHFLVCFSVSRSLTLQMTGDGGVSTWKWGDMRNIKALIVTGKRVAEQNLQKVVQSHLANDWGRRCVNMEVGRYAQHKGTNRDRKKCP